jgi:hypothetical protein
MTYLDQTQFVSAAPVFESTAAARQPRGELASRTLAMPADTNPFPQGLFQLPENPSVRVGFGPNR